MPVSLTIAPREKEPNDGDILSLPTVRGVDKALMPSAEAVAAVREIARRDMERKKAVEGTDTGRQDSEHLVGEAIYKQVTLSARTAADYLHRGSQIFQRYLRENDFPADTALMDASAVHFIHWALSLKAGLRPSSWRNYRRSLLHYLSGYPGNEMDEAIALLETDIIENSSAAAKPVRHPKAPSRPYKTSATKEKRFPAEDLERVKLYLRVRSRSTRARTLSAWLSAGILTGLRPTEWKATDIRIIPDGRTVHGRRVFLFVMNAKSSNGRSTGHVRTLDLSLMEDDEIKPILAMSKAGREWGLNGVFAKEQNEHAKMLSAVLRQIWPRRKRHYSLYSCRHQAIANWKTTLSNEEVSAMCGHAVIDTAIQSYGRRSAAWRVLPGMPRPLKEEVAIVVQRMELHNQRQVARRYASP